MTANSPAADVRRRADKLFGEEINGVHCRVDRWFAHLMLFQYLTWILLAVIVTPRSWVGSVSHTHLHVWASLFLGGAITLAPVLLVHFHPGRAITRHVIAAAQMLMSALLIHLTDGRIESHFHVFGSLAFLAFYRDWRVFIPATLVIGLDHLIRGMVWPESVYGVLSASPWRSAEHAVWVIFEDIFLIRSCQLGVREMRRLAIDQAQLESTNANIEAKVIDRTAQLHSTNEKLRVEVSERRAAEARVRYLALHDALTGLPNRTLFLDHLRDCEQRAKEQVDFHYAILFLDLDNFKNVNDSLGHAAGDELLVEVAKRLVTSVRNSDGIAQPMTSETARFGGDEFVILLDGVNNLDTATRVAERINLMFAEPLQLAGQNVFVATSIGIAMSGSSSRPDELLRDADTALYRAKAGGKSRYVIFDRQMYDDVRSRVELERDLRAAGELGQIEMAYQPIVSIGTARVVGFESLMRWRHPFRGLIPPCDFIPLAEEVGLIVPLGRWALREACMQVRRWNAGRPADDPVSMSVNVSKRQLAEPSFCKWVRDALKESRLEARLLHLEITESTITHGTAELIEALRNLRELNVGLHMDDFGTGLSSLSALHTFPFDVLKIDRMFVETMTSERRYAAFVHAIVNLAHNLRMKVTAEGIETPQQLAQTIALGCDYAQGNYFGCALNANEATKLLSRTFDIPCDTPESITLDTTGVGYQHVG